MVSYTGSRRANAPWWKQEDWDSYDKAVNYGILATYYQAKIVADEVLYEVGKKSATLTTIGLRAGTLTDNPPSNISLGKIDNVKGKVSRVTVAQTTDALLAADGVKTSWLDLIEGTATIDAEVSRVVSAGEDSAEGEAVFNA